MTFLNQRLPTQVETGAVMRDEEDVEIVTTDGGYEVRNARAAQSLREFDIAFPAARPDDATQAAVKALYKVARGQLHTWRFRDFSDYQLTAEAIGTGNGATLAFQITQSYTVDGNTVARTITRPVSPMQVFKDGVLAVSGYSINYATGVLTFVSAPANGVVITVTGEFDIPVRFDSVRTVTAIDGRTKHIDTMTVKEVRE